MEETQDLLFIELLKKGDKTVFAQIVRKYEKPLLRFAMRYIKDEEMARDVLQETLLKVYLHISAFEGRCSLKNWLYKITLNTARNKIRSQKESENIDEVVLVEACHIESTLIKEEMIKKLKKYVSHLPEKQKKTIELRVFEDLSFKEVSLLMNCPYDTAKANYRHAMLRLKEYLAAG